MLWENVHNMQSKQTRPERLSAPILHADTCILAVRNNTKKEKKAKNKQQCVVPENIHAPPMESFSN